MVDPIALLRLTIRYVITNRPEVLDYMSGAHGFKTYVVVKSQFLSTSICSKGFFWKWSMTMYHPLDYYVHRNNMGNWWKNSGILRLAPSQHVFIWLGPSTGGSPKTIGFNTKIGLMTWMIWVYPYFRKPPYIIYIIYINTHLIHLKVRISILSSYEKRIFLPHSDLQIFQAFDPRGCHSA